MSPPYATEVDPWERGTYVLVVDGEPAGTIELIGIDEAIEQALAVGRGEHIGSFVSLDVYPEQGSNGERWLSKWQNTPKGDRHRHLRVRDNRGDRWLEIVRCFFTRHSMDGSGTLAINGVRFVDGPSP